MNGEHKTGENAGTTTASATPQTEGERLIRLPATLHAVELGRSAWLDLVRSKQAPQPVHIGRATFWVASEIQTFIAERIAVSRAGR